MLLKLLVALKNNSTSLFTFPNIHINMGCMTSRTKEYNEGSIFFDSESLKNNLSRSNLNTEEILTTLKDMDGKESENPIREQDGGLRTPRKPRFSMSLSAPQNFSEPNWSTECHADYSNGVPESYLEALRLCDAEMEMTPECLRTTRDYGNRFTQTYTGKKIFSAEITPKKSVIIAAE